MATFFSYETSGPIEPDIKSSIRKEAEQLKLTHNWWCETIRFDPGNLLVGKKVPGTDRFEAVDQGRSLEGFQKVSFGGFSGYTAKDGQWVEVDYDDDQFMALRDAQFIISHLCAWSKQHGIGWNLSYGDEEIGNIIQGQADPSIEEFLQRFFESKHNPPNEAIARELAESIDRKYASRK
jgi:hypothetical protein